MIPGGRAGAVAGTAAPCAALSGWLVTDAQAELKPSIRRLARAWGVEPEVGSWEEAGLRIRPLPVTHTSHTT